MINIDTFITGSVDETYKTHRKAAMYAILGDLLFYRTASGRDFNRRRQCWQITVCDH